QRPHAALGAIARQCSRQQTGRAGNRRTFRSRLSHRERMDLIMASWHLAPALDRLRDEVNAKWPNRSKASDGTIGDASHSSRTSDHNPNSRGSVNAIDITASGISTDTLIAAAKKHPSVRYIIFNRRIMNRDIGNFRSRPYSGSNPHTAH